MRDVYFYYRMLVMLQQTLRPYGRIVIGAIGLLLMTFGFGYFGAKTLDADWGEKVLYGEVGMEELLGEASEKDSSGVGEEEVQESEKSEALESVSLDTDLLS